MAISATYSALSRIMQRKWNFLVAFLVVFFLTLSALFALGVAPSSMIVAYQEHFPSFTTPVETPSTTTPTASTKPLFEAGKGEAPIGIEIPSVGVNANVLNPTATDVETLDAALLKGAVRYPTSARLGELGNVVIFGHSSHLPIVHNQSFKAFNEISKLKEGEPIYVYSQGKRYTYSVESVREENTDTGAIALTTDSSKLTLATCNNFGTKADRYVVVAKLTQTIDLPKPTE